MIPQLHSLYYTIATKYFNPLILVVLEAFFPYLWRIFMHELGSFIFFLISMILYVILDFWHLEKTNWVVVNLRGLELDLGARRKANRSPAVRQGTWSGVSGHLSEDRPDQLQ